MKHYLIGYILPVWVLSCFWLPETAKGVASEEISGWTELTLEFVETDADGERTESGPILADLLAEEGETCVDLISGSNAVAGEVCVENDSDNLSVTYTTTGSSNLELTHLAVSADEPGGGEWMENDWQSPSGNANRGKFPYSTNHASNTDTYTYTLSLSDITGGVQADDKLFISAHAVVQSYGSSWGEGTLFRVQGNEAMYFGYTVGEGSDEEEDDTVSSDLSLDAPSSLTHRASDGSNKGNTSLDVTYSYTEVEPDAVTITFDDGSGNTATYNIDDSGYAGDNSEKTVSLDLTSPASTGGSGFVDGSTYDITVEATDNAGNSSSVTGTNLLEVDNTRPVFGSSLV
ncbi:MAG: hypothetical protein WD552_01020, partial [Candidatus Paceibacterota bacterium]